MRGPDKHTLGLLTEFLGTLGVTSNDDDVLAEAAGAVLAKEISGKDFRKVLVVCVVREDIRKLVALRWQMDPHLKRLGISLEEAIAWGMRKRRIEFLEGVEGIVTERCYQAAEDKDRSADQPAESILAVWHKVPGDYTDYFDETALAQIRLRYDGMARRVRSIAKSVRKIYRVFFTGDDQRADSGPDDSMDGDAGGEAH